MNTYVRMRRLASAAIVSGLIAGALSSAPANAATLKVLKQGLGAGQVTGSMTFPIITPFFSCADACDVPVIIPQQVILTANPGAQSVFVQWLGDCAGQTSPTCVVPMNSDRLVRAEFRMNPDVPVFTDFTPEGISNHLNMYQNLIVTPADFLRALPPEYKSGWILMTRSESLQTGTARFPRILLPSADARSVFTIGLSRHAAYPGADPQAIEYMQWDAGKKNFRFHEIVLGHIDAVKEPQPVGPDKIIFPARERGVSIDEDRCTRCHSTRNVLNRVTSDRGTTGSPPGTVKAKNKPNWDAYDSWAGAMPFNRDRIYVGSLEAAAFRKLFNPWTWRSSPEVRSIMEQLELQPAGVPASDVITRQNGGLNDGTPTFSFDGGAPPGIEPLPTGTPLFVAHPFDFPPPLPAPTMVMRGGTFVRLHATATPTSDEGRGVQLFDLLGGLDGNLNQTRVGDELANHRFMTGGIPLDSRPLALAITKRCLFVNPANGLGVAGSTPLNISLPFFTARNEGLDLAQMIANTRTRTQSLPLRKANLQKFNLDRDADMYLMDPIPSPQIDLISEYGIGTPFGTQAGIDRLRQEVFRRPRDAGVPDSVMGGIYVDRESYPNNTPRIALFRYFLEPLGVAVDKWSMSVRGRSRTYSFADIFEDFAMDGLGADTYTAPLQSALETSLAADPYPALATPFACGDIITAVNSSLSGLPAPTATAIPTYTDVQRVLNKGCIECHGGLDYPPFARQNRATSIDFSEEENPTSGSRLSRPFTFASPLASRILQLITRTNEACTDPSGAQRMMPCGGPALSEADVNTIRRWVPGATMFSEGDPHLRTLDGTAYDFQSAGEFSLLQSEGIDLQVRQTPVQADGPLGPDAHTGLSSCPSINTAVAMRVGPHRITLEPNLSGIPDPNGMQLRVDGKLQEKLGERGIMLAGGGRIMSTTAPGGIQIQYQDGTDVVLTPGWWDYYQLWYLNIDVRRARANFGVAGPIAPDNWLPALPDGSFLGPKPTDLVDRYKQLYVRFADAWRVTSKSSLFDYAPGTSTATYTLKGWPAHEPKSCQLPKGWDPGREPPKRLSNDEARQLCSAVVDPARRANCETDVMATGDRGFAQTYLAATAIQNNLVPKAPSLGSPADGEPSLPASVLFSWKPPIDKDGGKLTQLHCVWPVNETLKFNQCTTLPGSANNTVASSLRATENYYWKVVVDDGQGGLVESETRFFSTK